MIMVVFFVRQLSSEQVATRIEALHWIRMLLDRYRVEVIADDFLLGSCDFNFRLLSPKYKNTMTIFNAFECTCINVDHFYCVFV